MDLHPKLLAAADMCDAGEDVNFDELAFLLRYAADELADRPQATKERDQLLERLRTRLQARCDLLNRPDSEQEIARNGTLAQLEALDETLDHELRTRYPQPGEAPTSESAAKEIFPADQFQSGR